MLLKLKQVVMIWSSKRKCSRVGEEKEPSTMDGREGFASSTREGPLPLDLMCQSLLIYLKPHRSQNGCGSDDRT